MFSAIENFPKLKDGQHAYRLDGGAAVVVEVLHHDVPEDTTGNNLIGDHHVALLVRAWQADEEGDVMKDGRGVPIEAPMRIESIVSSALAEGTVDLENKIAEYEVAALERIQKWLVVKQQMSRVPKVSNQ